MALTVTHHAATPGKGATRPLFGFGGRPLSVWTGTIAFDATYPAGGETLDFTSAGEGIFREVLAVIVLSKGGYVFEYDYTAKKVLAYHSDYDAVADGPLVENTTTDISAVATGVRVIAFGIK